MLRDLGPVEPPAPQSYDIACPKGHRLRGYRNEGYQAIRCPTCGEGIFVLPRSPLPDPKATTPNGRSPSTNRRENEEDTGPIPLVDPPRGRRIEEENEAEIEWVDSETEPTERGQDVEISIEEELAARRDRKQKSGSVIEKEVEEEEEPEEEFNRPSRSDWTRGKRPALAVAAVLILVAATVGLSIRRGRLREYPRWVERGRTEGIEALDRGEFDKARTILTRAREGVNALGSEIQGADTILQAAAEADLIADLVPKTLEEILDEAATYPNLDDWPAHFRQMYKGRAIIIDSTVRRAGNPKDLAESIPLELDYLVLTKGPGSPRAARISVKGVVLFQYLDLKAGDRIVFGARLASLSTENEGSGWVVELEPKSAGLMTHPKALSALGFPNPEDPTMEGR